MTGFEPHARMHRIDFVAHRRGVHVGARDTRTGQEPSRQRIRPSLRRSIYQDCPCCKGVGQVKTSESLTIEVMRLVMLAASTDDVDRIIIETHDRVANDLNNRKRKELTRLEEEQDVRITIVARSDVKPEHLSIRCEDETGREIQV